MNDVCINCVHSEISRNVENEFYCNYKDQYNPLKEATWRTCDKFIEMVDIGQDLSLNARIKRLGILIK